VCMEIDLRWVRASLRGYGGEAPTGAASFDLLALEPGWVSRATRSLSAWQSANVELFAVDMELENFSRRGCQAISVTHPTWLETKDLYPSSVADLMQEG